MHVDGLRIEKTKNSDLILDDEEEKKETATPTAAGRGHLFYGGREGAIRVRPFGKGDNDDDNGQPPPSPAGGSGVFRWLGSSVCTGGSGRVTGRRGRSLN